MIEQQGRVVEADNGRVHVALGGRSGCAACDAGRGCGAGVFGKLLRRRNLVLDLQNTIGARPGQAVMVGLPESLFLALSGRFYLWPLLAGLAGAFIGHHLAGMVPFGPAATDALTFFGGLCAGTAVLLRNREGSTEFSGFAAVHLLRVVDGPDLNDDEEVLL